MVNPTQLVAPFTVNLSAQTPAGATAFTIDSGSPSPGYWPWGTGTWGEQGPWGEWGTVQLQLADGDAVSVSSEHLSPTKGALTFRFTRHFDTGAEEIVLVCGTDGSGTDWLQLSIDASDHLVMTWTADGGTERNVTSTDTLSTGIEYFLSFEWQHTMMALVIGSGAKVSGVRDAPEGSWGAGDLVLEADGGSNAVGPLLLADRPLTFNEIAWLDDHETWTLDIFAAGTAGELSGVLTFVNVLRGTFATQAGISGVLSADLVINGVLVP